MTLVRTDASREALSDGFFAMLGRAKTTPRGVDTTPDHCKQPRRANRRNQSTLERPPVFDNDPLAAYRAKHQAHPAYAGLDLEFDLAIKHVTSARDASQRGSLDATFPVEPGPNVLTRALRFVTRRFGRPSDLDPAYRHAVEARIARITMSQTEVARRIGAHVTEEDAIG